MTHPMAAGGYSIFHQTMADMTYPEIVDASRNGAVVLWAMGVIEQHGPHLPLGTDVYLPYALFRRAREILASRGIPSVQMPPFYYGVNVTTARFPGSFEVRPDIMAELMADLIRSINKDGFRTLFCLSGHGDLMHNRTILEGLKKGASATSVRGHFICTQPMFERLKTDPAFDPSDPPVLVMQDATKKTPFVDIHAGEIEGSMMWGLYSDLVRKDVIGTLKSTDFQTDDLVDWRKDAVRKTPLGYVGDPAASHPDTGSMMMERQAEYLADAIQATVGSANGV